MKNKFKGTNGILLLGGILILLFLAVRLIAGWIGGPTADFIIAAQPWVLMAIGIACVAAGWTNDQKDE